MIVMLSMDSQTISFILFINEVKLHFFSQTLQNKMVYAILAHDDMDKYTLDQIREDWILPRKSENLPILGIIYHIGHSFLPRVLGKASDHTC